MSSAFPADSCLFDAPKMSVQGCGVLSANISVILQQ